MLLRAASVLPDTTFFSKRCFLAMAASGTIHVAELAKSGRSTCKKVRRVVFFKAAGTPRHTHAPFSSVALLDLRDTSRLLFPRLPPRASRARSATKKSKTRRCALASHTTTATA